MAVKRPEESQADKQKRTTLGDIGEVPAKQVDVPAAGEVAQRAEERADRQQSARRQGDPSGRMSGVVADGTAKQAAVPATHEAAQRVDEKADRQQGGAPVRPSGVVMDGTAKQVEVPAPREAAQRPDGRRTGSKEAHDGRRTGSREASGRAAGAAPDASQKQAEVPGSRDEARPIEEKAVQRVDSHFQRVDSHFFHGERPQSAASAALFAKQLDVLATRDAVERVEEQLHQLDVFATREAVQRVDEKVDQLEVLATREAVQRVDEQVHELDARAARVEEKVDRLAEKFDCFLELLKPALAGGGLAAARSLRARSEGDEPPSTPEAAPLDEAQAEPGVGEHEEVVAAEPAATGADEAPEPLGVDEEQRMLERPVGDEEEGPGQQEGDNAEAAAVAEGGEDRQTSAVEEGPAQGDSESAEPTERIEGNEGAGGADGEDGEESPRAPRGWMDDDEEDVIEGDKAGKRKPTKADTLRSEETGEGPASDDLQPMDSEAVTPESAIPEELEQQEPEHIPTLEERWAEEEGEEQSPPESVDTKTWVDLGGEKLEALLDDIDLIDVNYIIELSEEEGRLLPRWQDVPLGARINKRNLHRIQEAINPFALSVLVVSYPWLDREHPDRNGTILRRLVPALKAFLQGATALGEGRTVGLMMDYPCMPQRHESGEDDRTPEELERFQRAKASMQEWYRHPHTTILVYDVDMPDVASGYANLRPHAQRGWCVYEFRTSCLVKSMFCIWSLAGYEKAGSKGTWASAVQGAKASVLRAAPTIPSKFAELLRGGAKSGELSFTDEADVELLIRQYEDAFVSSFAEAKDLMYHFLHWTDTELYELADSLVYAREQGLLQHCLSVRIAGNKNSDAGRQAVQRVLQGTKIIFNG